MGERWKGELGRAKGTWDDSRQQFHKRSEGPSPGQPRRFFSTLRGSRGRRAVGQGRGGQSPGEGTSCGSSDPGGPEFSARKAVGTFRSPTPAVLFSSQQDLNACASIRPKLLPNPCGSLGFSDTNVRPDHSTGVRASLPAFLSASG